MGFIKSLKKLFFRLISLVLVETFLWSTLATDLALARPPSYDHLRPSGVRAARDGGIHRLLTDLASSARDGGETLRQNEYLF